MTKGLEALESLMNNYYEMCEDTLNNDDNYQKYNLTSERAVIEKELKKPQELYNKIKEKRDNAQKDLHKGVAANKIKDVKIELIGQVNAYNDILSLIESMFEVSGDGK